MESHVIQTQGAKEWWSPAVRIGFRFCFVYLGLFCLLTQIVTNLISSSQGVDIPDLATRWPVRPLVAWTASHVFHVNAPLSFGGNSGSGDCTFGWVLAFCLLAIALVTTGIWSFVDRRRSNNAALHEWFWLFVRFALAGQMFNYGIVKVVPLQMPYPSLTRLVQPFGTFSPMGVLWTSIGASPAYEIFAGCAEVLGGILLIVPRTATLGALICLADMVQVFLLNMTYDVPVKLFALHLVLLSCFLLARDGRRLASVLFLNRATAASRAGRLFRSVRANRLAVAAQIVVGIWLVAMNGYCARESWSLYGGGSPRSRLYGIWEVSRMTVDGVDRAPLVTDNGRWRRAIFDAPAQMAFQRMDDSFVYYAATVNVEGQSVVLSRRGQESGRFTFQRPGKERLVLDGRMDDHQLHLELQLMDRQKFLLLRRGFHWVQDTVVNR